MLIVPISKFLDSKEEDQQVQFVVLPRFIELDENLPMDAAAANGPHRFKKIVQRGLGRQADQYI